ncbi:ribosomal protein S12 methylthiotransferase accessory factor [Tenacibaculum sp. MAR_2009_124]|uniref:YcaO-like family protein n=1 Tax=Tenacibaculum sp. MAR_2009_124 TaxID=1250059 RepID=UPI00089607DD|nr:YcaO-like family protein [Tenacibaculum sp. MAR_2009_124]SEB47408.1 ribosomal protein S12 methylthiotransferase accessory factor [Tenacibaculum sp. MAR_2009_124]
MQNFLEERTEYIQWHPRFNLYILENKDLLLFGEVEQFLLKANDFPGFHLINEQKDKINVSSMLQVMEPAEKNLFIYQAEQLTTLKLLIKGCSNTINSIKGKYVQPSDKIFELPIYPIETEIISINQTMRMYWLSLLSIKDRQEIKNMVFGEMPYFSPSFIDIVFVDDFLDGRISNISFKEKFMVIKISGDIIKILPVFSKESFSIFTKVQRRILKNQPIKEALKKKFSKQTSSYKFRKNRNFNNDQIEILRSIILEQLNSPGNSTSLITYNLITNKTEKHPIDKTLTNIDDIANQLHSPLLLRNRKVFYTEDGGSRICTPKETLEKLLPLISAETGIINRIEKIPSETNTQIQIFRTGYYKSFTNTDFQFNIVDFVQTSLGKGVSIQQSKVSALSESIERYNALYQPDIPLYKISLSSLLKLNYRAISFHELSPYSDRQYLQFTGKEFPSSKLKHAVRRYTNEKIYWLPVWSLSKKENVYIPLTCCFSNLPFKDVQFGKWNSNGCAAGNVVEEAVLQGLFELIERDATAIWWYNKITCPVFKLTRIDASALEKFKKSMKNYNFWILDITNDIGIPVMVGVAKDKTSGKFTLGFGCHLIPELAAQRALTELCQLIPIRNTHTAPFAFNAIQDEAFLYGENTNSKKEYSLEYKNDLKTNIEIIVAHFQKLDLEVLVLNYSRNSIPLSTVKVFVPGLCHIWPQLANRRLYEVPVLLGCLSRQKTEETLNCQELYI